MTKNSNIIIREAEHLGLKVEIISNEKHLFVLHGKNKSLTVCELFSITRDPSGEAYRLSKDKILTYLLWKRARVPFPKYYHFKNLLDFQEKLPNIHFEYPIILKESSGSKSINVSMDIRSAHQLKKAASSYKKGFIAQQMVIGKEYRLLLHQGRLLGALLLIPPYIIGDGKHTIRELINLVNHSKAKKLVLNEKSLASLQSDGFSAESIPKKNTTVYLQKNSRLAQGGESHDCTAIVHPKILRLAKKAIEATNLDLGGLDLICDDITLPPTNQKFMFLEVNTYPDLSIHYEPTHGSPQPVARLILENIFNIKVR